MGRPQVFPVNSVVETALEAGCPFMQDSTVWTAGQPGSPALDGPPGSCLISRLITQLRQRWGQALVLICLNNRVISCQIKVSAIPKPVLLLPPGPAAQGISVMSLAAGDWTETPSSSHTGHEPLGSWSIWAISKLFLSYTPILGLLQSRANGKDQKSGSRVPCPSTLAL